MILLLKAHKYVVSKVLLLDQLKERNEELETLSTHVSQQNNLLQQHFSNITASLRYASHMQRAILSDDSVLANSFFSHFIFFKPRDIVSGDFYFIKSIKNRLIVAVADCT
ncbi:MAG TPA: hypothetical protein VIH57_11120, partial [Bacteroidales bacterium]